MGTREKARGYSGDYKCKFCNKLVKDSFNKKRHERQHTEKYPYKCRYCVQIFGDPSTKSRHEKIHITKPEKTWSSCDVWSSTDVAIALLELKR